MPRLLGAAPKAGARPAGTTAWWSRRTLARDQAVFGYSLLAPAALLMIVLVGVPFVRALWLSFHKKLLGAEEAPWIGAQNYTTLLSDPTFWQAVTLASIVQRESRTAS